MTAFLVGFLLGAAAGVLGSFSLALTPELSAIVEKLRGRGDA